MDKVIELLSNKELKSKVEIVGSKVKLSVMLDSKGVDAELAVMLEGAYFLDKLKDVIPGEIDNIIIDLVKSVLAK